MSRLLVEPTLILRVCSEGEASPYVSDFNRIPAAKDAGGTMSAPVLLKVKGSLLTGRRILIVEDEYFLADDIARACRALGAEIEGPFSNGEDAQAGPNGLRMVDGAVLDVNLKNASVFPVARTLRSRGVRFVFTTGHDRSVIEPEFGDVPLWEKPLDVATMTCKLSELILQH
jgi:CheY-like chemotaxis protein